MDGGIRRDGIQELQSGRRYWTRGPTVIGTNDIEARSAFYFMTSPLERHEAPEISADAPDF